MAASGLVSKSCQYGRKPVLSYLYIGIQQAIDIGINMFQCIVISFCEPSIGSVFNDSYLRIILLDKGYRGSSVEALSATYMSAPLENLVTEGTDSARAIRHHSNLV